MAGLQQAPDETGGLVWKQQLLQSSLFVVSQKHSKVRSAKNWLNQHFIKVRVLMGWEKILIKFDFNTNPYLGKIAQTVPMGVYTYCTPILQLLQIKYWPRLDDIPEKSLGGSKMHEDKTLPIEQREEIQFWPSFGRKRHLIG